MMVKTFGSKNSIDPDKAWEFIACLSSELHTEAGKCGLYNEFKASLCYCIVDCHLIVPFQTPKVCYIDFSVCVGTFF